MGVLTITVTLKIILTISIKFKGANKTRNSTPKFNPREAFTREHKGLKEHLQYVSNHGKQE